MCGEEGEGDVRGESQVLSFCHVFFALQVEGRSKRYGHRLRREQ